MEKDAERDSVSELELVGVGLPVLGHAARDPSSEKVGTEELNSDETCAVSRSQVALVGGPSQLDSAKKLPLSPYME